MKLRKIGKQLERELKANPGKAGVLALLLGVAVWFWGPLLWKSEHSTSGAATVHSSIAHETVGNAGLATATAAFDWSRWAEAIASDPLMVPLGHRHLTLAHHNPFATTDARELSGAGDDRTTVEPLLAVAPAELPADLPRQLGMQLTSTVVASRQATALVNGEVYRLGDSIPAGMPATGGQFAGLTSPNGDSIKFELVAIHSAGVSLAYDGRIYDLPLETSSAAKVVVHSQRLRIP